MFHPLFDLIVRFAGYTADELRDRLWAIRMRRLVLGLLVIGSGFFAAAMLTLAVARIDPANSYRWFYSIASGLIYFAMVTGYDSLFVASTDSARGRSVWMRIGLSFVIMAFSATTLDSTITGDRLLSEIDKRRTEATLEAQQRHRAVHGLDDKASAMASATKAFEALDNDLAGDPQTAEFEEALSNVSSALEDWREIQTSLGPKVAELRVSIAGLRAQISQVSDDDTGEREALATKLAQLRQQRTNLERTLAEKKRTLDVAARRADELRKQWREDKLAQRAVAQRERADTGNTLRAAQQAADRDSAASRETNAQAFKANLVEELVAFWSLALREKGYLVVGVIVWLAAVAFELLAILTKLLLKPDSLDAERRSQAMLEAIRAETEVQIAREDGVEHRLRLERARMESECFLDALRLKAQMAEACSHAVVTAFLKMQEQTARIPDPKVHESLDAQFTALQKALDRQLEARMGLVTAAPTAGTAADSVALAGGDAPVGKPRDGSAAKTVLL